MADWAKQDKWHKEDPATWARRLKKLRPFTRYLQQFEPLTEIPDASIFGKVPERGTPHIYHDQEIVDLLAAAKNLGPHGDLRAATYETRFGLSASAGLRVSEAVHLLDSDVDLKSGMLTVRQTKFAKSRQLPLHSSTVEALLRYLRMRNFHIVVTPETNFFVGTRGKLLGQCLRVGSLDNRCISPHTIRRTTAMHLLQSGVHIETIALYLGHENPATAHMYVEANLAMKDRALSHLQDPCSKVARYHAPDALLQFLKTL
jgi:integrase